MDMQRMTQRQQAFRTDFRARIARAYLGWVHVALIAAIGWPRSGCAPGRSPIRPGTSGW
jgi:hypothetical protein